MSPQLSKNLLAKGGAVFAVGLVSSSIFASMPAAEALDSGTFGKTISAAEAEKSFRNVPVDHSELLKAVEEAKAAGLTVDEDALKRITVASTLEVVSARAEIKANYEQQISDMEAKVAQHKDAVAKAKAAYEADKEANDKHNAGLKADYEAKLAIYQQAKAEYDKAKAAYDELVAAQTKQADPNVAQTPDTLAYAQTISINENRNSLVSIDGANVTREFTADDSSNTDYVYNSDLVKVVSAHDGMSFSATWDKAVKTSDGRQLDAKLTFSNIVTASTDGLAGTNRPAEIAVYSNYSDSIATWLIAGGTVKVQYFDDATGVEYDKDFYQTAGSLNNQGKRAEFASPIVDPEAKIKASFLNKGSWVSKSVEPVYGKASQITDTGFRLPSAQAHGVSDETDDALSLLGVTFLGSSGMSFNFGVSGVNPGTDPQPDELYWAWYNHLMLSANTVAPTASEPVAPPAPAEPEYRQDPVYVAPAAPSASYRLAELSAPVPVVEKIAVDEGKKVLAGETTTQTISYATGYEAPAKFVIGDHIYKTEDGRLPVSVDMSEVAVTDAEGNNVTADFSITQEEGVLGGKAGVQILATAKDPAGLKLNHTYTLHVNQTSLFDGVADTLQDAGFAITGDELQFTDIKTYGEPKLNPDKTVVNSAGLEVDGTKVLPGAELNYELKLSAADLTNTSSDVTTLGMVDDYDETKWQPSGKFTVKDSDGKDVDASKFTYENKDGVITVLAKNPSELVGKDYIITLEGMVKWDAKPGSFSNQATQLTNQDKTVTKTVTNYVPVITPAKVETSPVNGANLDGKTLMVGDVINYTLVEDTTDLVNASENISQSGMKDDFDETAGKIDLSAVKVYQVPADTDTSTPEATAKAIKATGAKDVTDSYDFALGAVEGFTNGGSEGYTGFMKTEGEGEAKKVVLPMGYKYIHVLPFTVTANVDGELLNTAWQVTNGVEAQTQTVANPMKKIQPAKDVSIQVGGESVDGGTLALGQVFNYQLKSSDLPGDRVKNIDSWTLVDDYDETKDEYQGNYLAQARFDVVDESGKVVIKAGDDITKYITQDWDEAAGKTTFSANDELLKLINLDANKAKEAGFEVFMQAKRIGTGEIVNTVTEFVNGEEIIADSDSNTPDGTDPNGPTTVITHTYDSDLRVDKEWIDADASDGKVSAKVSGTNLGEGVALNARLSDEVFKGLANPTVIAIENGTKGEFTAESTALVFDQVAKGDKVSVTLEFDVLPGVEVVDNTAAFENEFDKAGDPNNIQENDGFEGDTDQRDKVSLELPKPEAPVTPEAGKTTPVIKGESAKTGAEANAQGISAGVFAGLGAAVLLGLGAVWAFVSRKKA